MNITGLSSSNMYRVQSSNYSGIRQNKVNFNTPKDAFVRNSLKETAGSVAFCGLFGKSPIDKAIHQLGVSKALEQKLSGVVNGMINTAKKDISYIQKFEIPTDATKGEKGLFQGCKGFMNDLSGILNPVLKGKEPTLAAEEKAVESAKSFITSMRKYLEEEAMLYPDNKSAIAIGEGVADMEAFVNKINLDSKFTPDDTMEFSAIMKKILTSVEYQDPASAAKVVSAIDDLTGLAVQKQLNGDTSLNPFDINTIANAIRKLSSVPEIKAVFDEARNI